MIQTYKRRGKKKTLIYIYIYDDDDDDDDDFVLFQVHHLDNYKDRSPGLHMWTLPPLVPTSHP